MRKTILEKNAYKEMILVKKVMAVFALAFAVLVANAHFAHATATIPENECRLGGIRLGMPYQEVEAMYGAPQWKTGDAMNGVAMYGQNIRVGFEENAVVYAYTRANNGWTTPSGLAVGMHLSDAVAIYGKGNLIGKAYLGEYYSWAAGTTGYIQIALSYDKTEPICYIEITTPLYRFKSNHLEHYE